MIATIQIEAQFTVDFNINGTSHELRAVRVGAVDVTNQLSEADWQRVQEEVAELARDVVEEDEERAA